MPGLNVYIGNDDAEIEASHLNVEYFPSFLRFDKIDIFFSSPFYNEDEDKGYLDSQPIAGKCQLLEDQLKLIKPALNGSIMNFDFIIDQSEPSRFYDHSKVLEYLRNRMLPICDKMRGYEFWITFDSDKNTARFVIASILKMEQVYRCSNLTFWLSFADRTELPIEEISNWLHRSYDNQRERSLFIHLSKIEKLVEVPKLLKEVFFYSVFFFLRNIIQNK